MSLHILYVYVTYYTHTILLSIFQVRKSSSPHWNNNQHNIKSLRPTEHKKTNKSKF